jgi:hypothetical protein
MSDLSRRGARRRGNSKSNAITGGMIVGMTVYPWDDRCSKLVGINIVKISEQHKAASLPARRGWVKKYDANKANLGSTWNGLSTQRA